MHVVHSVGFAIAVGFGWFYLICPGRTGSELHMNRLSSRSNWLKFIKTYEIY